MRYLRRVNGELESVAASPVHIGPSRSVVFESRPPDIHIPRRGKTGISAVCLGSIREEIHVANHIRHIRNLDRPGQRREGRTALFHRDGNRFEFLGRRRDDHIPRTLRGTRFVVRIYPDADISLVVVIDYGEVNPRHQIAGSVRRSGRPVGQYGLYVAPVHADIVIAERTLQRVHRNAQRRLDFLAVLGYGHTLGGHRFVARRHHDAGLSSTVTVNLPSPAST